LSLGLGTGAFCAGPLTARLGRIRVHGLLMAPVAALWVALAFPPNATAVIIIRVLIGFLHGMRLAIGQLYVTEVSYNEIRGMHAAISISFNPFGMFLGALLIKYMYWRTAVRIY
jgi:MFS family permease